MLGRGSHKRGVSERPAPADPIAMLAICDSAVVRQLVAGAVAKESDLIVTTAFDWRHAEHLARGNRPDVAVLCSDRLWPDDEDARPIHQLGIPFVVGTLDLREANVSSGLSELLSRVRQVPRRLRARTEARSPPTSPGKLPPFVDTAIPRTSPLVVVGASAGGTVALKSILQALPPGAPPLLIVQHMSDHFTGTFARGLDRICSIEVREAEDGDAIVAGRALIAPGNRHLFVERRGSEYVARLHEGPSVARHRPSVNVLFRSAAQEAGANAIGVILTGMGDDGADGLFEMKGVGARTIAQNEATSAVFGMPRAAILRGGVEKTAALGDVAAAILECASSPR